MSGLEVAASVAAIVASYSAVRDLVKDVNQVRKERKQASEPKAQQQPKSMPPAPTHSSYPLDDDFEKEWGVTDSNVRFARSSNTPRPNNKTRTIIRQKTEFINGDSDDEPDWS